MARTYIKRLRTESELASVNTNENFEHKVAQNLPAGSEVYVSSAEGEIAAGDGTESAILKIGSQSSTSTSNNTAGTIPGTRLDDTSNPRLAQFGFPALYSANRVPVVDGDAIVTESVGQSGGTTKAKTRWIMDVIVVEP